MGWVIIPEAYLASKGLLKAEIVKRRPRTVYNSVCLIDDRIMRGPAVYRPHTNLSFVYLGPSAPPLLGQGYNVMASRWRVMGHTWARNPASLSWKPDSAKRTPGSLPTAGGRATRTQPFPGFSAKTILSWCLFKTLTYLRSRSHLTASLSSSIKLNQPCWHNITIYYCMFLIYAVQYIYIQCC